MAASSSGLSSTEVTQRRLRDSVCSPQDMASGSATLGSHHLLFDHLRVFNGHKEGFDLPPLMLNIPSQQVGPHGAPAYAFGTLDRSSSMFKRLRDAISKLRRIARETEDETTKQACEAVIDAYRTYIDQIRAASGVRRIALIDGSTFLVAYTHGKLGCQMVEQEEGRKATSLDSRGRNERKNAEGLNLVQLIGDIYAKRIALGELHPDAEKIAYYVAKLLGNSEAPYPLVALVHNVVTTHYTRKGRAFTPPDGKSIAAWIGEDDERRKELLFELTRHRNLIQLKREVRGLSLRKLMEDPSFIETIDLALFDEAIFWELALFDGDGTPDNFINLIRIDWEQLWRQPIAWVVSGQSRQYFLYFKSILCLLPQMGQKIPEQRLKWLRELKVEESLIDLLCELEQENAHYQTLIEQGIVTEEELAEINLPITLPKGGILRLYQTLMAMKRCAESPEPTYWDLFEAIDPLSARAYEFLSKMEDDYVNCFRRPLPEEFLSREDIAPLLENVSEICHKPPKVQTPSESVVTVVEEAIGHLPADRQKVVLTHLKARFPRLQSLSLCSLSMSGEELVVEIKSWSHLTQLSLARTEIRFQDVHHLISQRPLLKITLGPNRNLKAAQLRQLIEFATNQSRELYMLADGERFSCLTQSWELLCRSLATGNTVFAEAIYAVGDPRNKQLLHKMAEEGCAKSIQFLQAHDPAFNPNQAEESKPYATPLHKAAGAGNSETIQALIEAGAAPDYFDSLGRTPIHIAAIEGHIEAFEELVNGGHNPVIVTEVGATALHLAVERGRVTFMRSLFEKGLAQSCVNLRNKDGKGPLHLAAAYPEIVNILLENGADPNLKTSIDGTPLQYAVRKGAAESVQLLMEKGARLDIIDRYGESPLTLALAGNWAHIATLLLEGSDAATSSSGAAVSAPISIAAASSSSAAATPPPSPSASVSPRSWRALSSSSSSPPSSPRPRRLASLRGAHFGSFTQKLLHKSPSTKVAHVTDEIIDEEKSALQKLLEALATAHTAIERNTPLKAAEAAQRACELAGPTLRPLFDPLFERAEMRYLIRSRVEPAPVYRAHYRRDRTRIEEHRLEFFSGIDLELLFFDKQEAFSDQVFKIVQEWVREYTVIWPKPTPFVCVAYGELARKEALPHPHIQLEFILEDEEHRPYFDRLQTVMRVRAVPLQAEIEFGMGKGAFVVIEGDPKLLPSGPRVHRVRRWKNSEDPLSGINDYLNEWPPGPLDVILKLSDLSYPLLMAIDGLLEYYKGPPSGAKEGIEWLLAKGRISSDDATTVKEHLETLFKWRSRAHRHFGRRMDDASSAQLEGIGLYKVDRTKLEEVHRFLSNLRASVEGVRESKRHVTQFKLGKQ